MPAAQDEPQDAELGVQTDDNNQEDRERTHKAAAVAADDADAAPWRRAVCDRGGWKLVEVCAKVAHCCCDAQTFCLCSERVSLLCGLRADWLRRAEGEESAGGDAAVAGCSSSGGDCSRNKQVQSTKEEGEIERVKPFSVGQLDSNLSLALAAGSDGSGRRHSRLHRRTRPQLMTPLLAA